MNRVLLFIAFSLYWIISKGQPSNNHCSGAKQLCFGTLLKDNNAGANADPWSTSCHSTNNTIWYTFTTNTKGGDVAVNVESECSALAEISGTLIAAPKKCDTSAFIKLNCNSGIQKNLTLSAAGLDPSTNYYIVINSESGNQPITCDFKISITGSGVQYSVKALIENAICFQKKGSVTFDDVMMGPGPYTYTLKDSSPQNSNYYSDVGVGTQTVKITDARGCALEETFTVDGLENHLTVDAGEDKTIIAGGSVQLKAEGNGISYYWDPPIGIAEPTSQIPLAAPNATQTYAVYAYTDENCQAVDYITVFVLPQITAPTAFTPNGDGVNDTWQILLIDQYPNSIIDIYSRWGQRVFKSNGYNQEQEWNGTHIGRILPAATYYFTIDLNSNTDDREAEIFNGSVTIIK